MPPESIASLDSDSSSGSSDGDYDEDEELRLAQLEWEENLRQLQLLLSVVLLPYVGKWLGRKWAHTCAFFRSFSSSILFELSFALV